MEVCVSCYDLSRLLFDLKMNEAMYQKSLEDFEKLYTGVGPQNYAWYQGKFQKLGHELYPKFKIGLIREFIYNYKIDGKKLDPITLLKQLAPDIMKQFLDEMK